MAGGVSVLPCAQSPVAVARGALVRGEERAVLNGRRILNRFRGLKGLVGIAGLRRRSFGTTAGEGCNRRRVTCAFGGGGSDTESCDVEYPVLTLYELLEISQEVGLSEIKTAYRQMARKYHPDVCPPAAKDECTKKFLQVQEAYEILVDPDLRADYDFRLRNPLSLQALTSGFAYHRRSGHRRHGATHDENPDKEVWRGQWEAQVGNLRKGRRKPGSWAERMRQQQEQRVDMNA